MCVWYSGGPKAAFTDFPSAADRKQCYMDGFVKAQKLMQSVGIEYPSKHGIVGENPPAMGVEIKLPGPQFAVSTDGEQGVMMFLCRLQLMLNVCFVISADGANDTSTGQLNQPQPLAPVPTSSSGAGAPTTVVPLSSVSVPFVDSEAILIDSDGELSIDSDDDDSEYGHVDDAPINVEDISDAEFIQSLLPCDYPRDSEGSSCVEEPKIDEILHATHNSVNSTLLNYVADAIEEIGDSDLLAAVDATVAGAVTPKVSAVQPHGVSESKVEEGTDGEAPTRIRVVALYILVPTPSGERKRMFIATLVSILSTDPRASADRAVRLYNAASGFIGAEDLICGDDCITVGVDCAWNFDNHVEFGRVLEVGKKISANGVRPIYVPVSLRVEHDENTVVACHYYEELSEADFAKTGLDRNASLRYYQLASARWSSLTCKGVNSVMQL